ncbi:MAG: hypothetical protein JNM27_16235 [Leptospirales bacterium]|nr:hypothetical protein [Leptospirales bacterium]
MDLAGRILHWTSRFFFPLSLLPLLFPYVPVLLFVLAGAAIVVYLGERKTGGLPLTQSRSFHVMRLCAIGGILNATLYFGLLLHSQACILRPLSNQLEPVREYYRGQGQTESRSNQ